MVLQVVSEFSTENVECFSIDKMILQNSSWILMRCNTAAYGRIQPLFQDCMYGISNCDEYLATARCSVLLSAGKRRAWAVSVSVGLVIGTCHKLCQSLVALVFVTEKSQPEIFHFEKADSDLW